MRPPVGALMPLQPTLLCTVRSVKAKRQRHILWRGGGGAKWFSPPTNSTFYSEGKKNFYLALRGEGMWPTVFKLSLCLPWRWGFATDLLNGRHCLLVGESMGSFSSSSRVWYTGRLALPVVRGRFVFYIHSHHITGICTSNIRKLRSSPSSCRNSGLGITPPPPSIVLSQHCLLYIE